MKKEEALKELGAAQKRIEALVSDDKRMRQELTKVLRYQDPYGQVGRFEEPMTWLQIAFHIGELKADADIQCMIEGRRLLESELDQLKEKLAQK